jgi:FixJ family two-component response regulator
MTLKCIAVVDDEAAVRVALRRLLCLANYTVETCASGEELLDSLAHRRPDCVLLDVHMPGLTGLQVQARMRAHGAALPVVFITASDDPEVARSALEGGGLSFLRKPFSNAELLSAVELALRSTLPTAR